MKSLQPSRTYKKQPRQQTRRRSNLYMVTTAQQSRTQRLQISNRMNSTRTTETKSLLSQFDKGRLGAPQLQAQLSWLSDRTRLRRLKNTQVTKGVWRQVARFEDLCHTHMSLVSDSTTRTRVRAVSLHRTTLSPTCRRYSTTSATRVREVAVPVEHSQTPSLSTEKFAALPKPLEATTRAFTPTSEH